MEVYELIYDYCNEDGFEDYRISETVEVKGWGGTAKDDKADASKWMLQHQRILPVFNGRIRGILKKQGQGGFNRPFKRYLASRKEKENKTMMTLKKYTPCDDGVCPYMDECGYVNCDWYCSAEEPEDIPDIWEEE